uniref:uncharacterized protein LOC120329853 n=1 Tax=Styela clava TaxID=7725 RepID=UPI00193A1FEB|nr:uncharacterized protein LOC120329853 [Styela clava]
MSSCLFECLKEAGLECYYSMLQRRGFDTAFSLLYLPPAELQDVGITTDFDRQRFLQLVQIIASFHQGGELSPRRPLSPSRSPKVKDRTSSPRRNLRTGTDRRSYQSSDSSNTSEELPTGYTFSPSRKQQNSIDNPLLKRDRQRNVNMPVPILTTNRLHRTGTKFSPTMEGITSHLDASVQRSNAFRDHDVVENHSDYQDGNNNVAQPENVPLHINFNNNRPSVLQSRAEDSDENVIVAKNIRMSTESLKIQKVMRTKGYNYGLPRDGHKNNGVTGLTPKMTRFTPARKSPFSRARPHSSPSPRDLNGLPPGQCRITVCVRKRPILEPEFKSGEFDVVTCNDEDGGKVGGLIVHELKHTVDMSEFVQQNIFQFDKVFAERVTNKDVYEGAVKPMVDWTMTQNHRATCFGYGQTGAGKTHTLLGDDSEPGVFFYAAKDVLSRLTSQHRRTNRGKRGFSLCVSLYEIYCSRIFDLLNGHNRLQALEDSNKQIHIHGLKSVNVSSIQALQEVVHQGLSSRSVGVTGANQDSSRSHAIVQLTVRDTNNSEFSRLSFIDLAGSERACDALKDSDKQNRLEGAEINQSLLALKECIRSLDLALAHTPFRQSKLTQVLRDSFIGNSKTCMIANISPSHGSLEHTMNTLRYASRVKELHRKPGSTPRQQRCRSTANSNRSAQRRPYTADPTFSQARPSNTTSRTPTLQISRSVSIESSMHVMDYTTAFTGNGREIPRTPPPTNSNSMLDSTTSAHETPQPRGQSIDLRLGGSESRNVPMHKKSSIFTPESIAASSTPNKKPNLQKERANRHVLTEISTNETTTSNSTPTSTPRFLNDTELVGGVPVTSSYTKSKQTHLQQQIENISNERKQSPNTTESTNERISSVSTSRTSKEKSSENYSNSSSVAVEHGSSHEQNPTTSLNSNQETILNSTNPTGKHNSKTSHKSISESEISDTDKLSSNRRKFEAKSERRSSTSALPNTNEIVAKSIVSKSQDVISVKVLPESTKNPGLPSPQKFLTHLKDKHSIKTKALKLQLRKARHRAKMENRGSEAIEDEGQSSDHSASSSSKSNLSTSSCSTSRSNLTSNVQRHHQELNSQIEASNAVGPVIVTNAQTPPRLPSPKLDRSLPRRSSKVLYGSSSRSASPGTGGRNTPDERSSVSSNPATTTGLTSASELHARLDAAAASLNKHSDNDDTRTSDSEKPLSSSTKNRAIIGSMCFYSF